MTNAAKLEMLFALVSLAFLFSFAWSCQLPKIRKSSRARLRQQALHVLALDTYFRGNSQEVELGKSAGA